MTGETIAGQLAGTKSSTTVTFPTSTGWVRLHLQDWAAIEIVE